MNPTIIMRAAGAIMCAMIAATALGKTNAAAGAPPPSVNETCLMCHAAADAKGADGKSIAVDGAKFAASVHGGLNLKCTDCHTDVSADKIPHAEKLKPVNCATCHEQQVKEYAATVHGKARKGGNNVAATCTDCHGTHDILRVQGSGIAHEPRERRSHMLSLPWQRETMAKGETPERQHRQQIPRQHPRQGAAGRRAGLCADLHELPRRAQHSRQERTGKPDEPREGARYLRRLPQGRSARRT